MLPLRLPDAHLHCLHLGDSYTIGEGVDATETWPAHLHDQLESRGVVVERIHLVARNAWTTTDLDEALDAASLGPEWNFLTLCIGVNNQYRGLDPAHYAEDLEDLIGRARLELAQPGSLILLLSIPDWGVSPFAADRDRAAVAREIDQFNAAASQVAAKTGVPFLDWTPLTRSFAKKDKAFTADGLHPNGEQTAIGHSLSGRTCRQRQRHSDGLLGRWNFRPCR